MKEVEAGGGRGQRTVISVREPVNSASLIVPARLHDCMTCLRAGRLQE